MSELQVYLVSGGTGQTGNQILRACLAQFPNQTVRILTESQVRTLDAACEVPQKAAASNGIICHSLVDPVVRNALAETALRAGVACIDLLGPTLAVLGERLAVQPAGKAGLLYELHKEQIDRMDAVDFTMAHDDGQRMHDIDQADAVLVGVSRVSKSVTCFYLASRGIRAANVPLLADVEVPQELLRMDAKKIFGLTMNASHLASIRQARLDRIAGRHEVPSYADTRQLNREIRAAEDLFSRQGWMQIDVSYKATEEVAAQIADTIRQNAMLAR